MSEEVTRVPESPVEPAKPPAAMVVSKTPEEVQADFLKMVPSYGSVESSVEQRAILFAPVNPDEVLIRPDGLVYLSWTAYVKRLRDAFGTQWSLMPRGNPAVRDGMVMAAYYLCIQGKVAGYAVGEAQQQGQMTYGDVLESAKSNALTRLCKGMGISLELWDPSFVRTWKAKYAIQDVPNPKKPSEMLWRRREAPAVVDLLVSVGPAMKAQGPVSTSPVAESVTTHLEILRPDVAVVIPPPSVKVDVAPATDPHEAPVPGTAKHEVYTTVKAVNVHKPSANSRQKNPSYRIIGPDGKTYYTFDKTLATIANEARKSGAEVKMDCEITSYGFRVLSLVSGPFDVPLPLGVA
jgi:uncharacterized glyoxalase superfamily protein PhnB